MSFKPLNLWFSPDSMRSVHQSWSMPKSALRTAVARSAGRLLLLSPTSLLLLRIQHVRLRRDRSRVGPDSGDQGFAPARTGRESRGEPECGGIRLAPHLHASDGGGYWPHFAAGHQPWSPLQSKTEVLSEEQRRFDGTLRRFVRPQNCLVVSGWIECSRAIKIVP